MMESMNLEQPPRLNADPWRDMEPKVDAMLGDLLMISERFRRIVNPTVSDADELIEAINSVGGEVETMRVALDTTIERPELFSIDAEELKRRTEKTRSWERDVAKAIELRSKILSNREGQIQDPLESDVMTPNTWVDLDTTHIHPSAQSSHMLMNSCEATTDTSVGVVESQALMPVGIPIREQTVKASEYSTASVEVHTVDDVDDSRSSNSAKKTVLIIFFVSSLLVAILVIFF
ncbi:hypothetical protein, conserved [Trypanosoma brucei gambiense DAL972]|uniref:Uncharacterized protein n=1 Tax=Trypanosoma brucei gambiense (strain MHOM/CI/86/DAL972) TaxID=679716 RepID=C9ZS14_TRYB9|nr:hypothetical protein, conserved [Trypanosoma brucei gambiense DAL972]CBH12150.1 hypothetical protein, conserved [Trypanosoma brucei gambiense DAL972]|eukprot:XP_011774433.1 hypothetical protein, conserved [Trypanosoma brucei gambiense DAL972]